jgi:transcriptional regulator with XRE-family HTH domain
MSEFSNRLVNLRESHDWSKTYVASHIGLKNMQTYANWEYGKSEPDQDMLKELANLYDVSVDFLIGNKQSGKSDDLSKNQKLVAYSIDPDVTDEEREAIINMVKEAMKFKRRI